MGPNTALTWALEIGDYTRFPSIKQAISYCGLCGDEKSSAEKVMRMPISKQRNKHIQGVLIVAAKLAPSDARLLGNGCVIMLDVTRNDLLFLEM
ncbi:MAG: IS110 family transposase [Acidobacteria bacterium]|nr:IS110 family transposase [Acidobacteriota bacterium]